MAMTYYYHNDIGNAVTRAIKVLRRTGHKVECFVTGDVFVDGIKVDGQRFEQLAVDYSRELEELEIAIDNIKNEAGPNASA